MSEFFSKTDLSLPALVVPAEIAAKHAAIPTKEVPEPSFTYNHDFSASFFDASECSGATTSDNEDAGLDLGLDDFGLGNQFNIANSNGMPTKTYDDIPFAGEYSGEIMLPSRRKEQDCSQPYEEKGDNIDTPLPNVPNYNSEEIQTIELIPDEKKEQLELEAEIEIGKSDPIHMENQEPVIPEVPTATAKQNDQEGVKPVATPWSRSSSVSPRRKDVLPFESSRSQTDTNSPPADSPSSPEKKVPDSYPRNLAASSPSVPSQKTKRGRRLTCLAKSKSSKKKTFSGRLRRKSDKSDKSDKTESEGADDKKASKCGFLKKRRNSKLLPFRRKKSKPDITRSPEQERPVPSKPETHQTRTSTLAAQKEIEPKQIPAVKSEQIDNTAIDEENTADDQKPKPVPVPNANHLNYLIR
eukprot:TRINITY_DN12028_c0_g1_i1.p1 TRINITY_DN12028_c0_g1~~TRINITY_DN12028_c0_g1_i1.p1  ORF type:complete len:412 (+),score=89.01 TRINITY_DN12028_c0_g1_i1:137-1372(+)